MAPAPTTTKLLADEVLLTHGSKAGDEDATPLKMTNGNGHINGGTSMLSERKSNSPQNSNGFAAKSSQNGTSLDGEGDVKNEDVDMDGYSKLTIVWRNVAIFVYLHAAALYGAYLWLSGQVMWQTFLWGNQMQPEHIHIYLESN